MKINFFKAIISVLLLTISCEKDNIVLIDESRLLGRWEPFSKSFVKEGGEEVNTSEDLCEWTDTYTFFENARLIYQDSVREEIDGCGDNPEFELEGKWSQDDNGVFTFSITRTIDNSILTITPKDLYFVQDEFLVIEFTENDWESGFTHSKIIFGKS